MMTKHVAPWGDMQPVVVPLYVDDELGGNESTFEGQLPVSVGGPKTDVASEARARDVVLAPKVCVGGGGEGEARD